MADYNMLVSSLHWVISPHGMQTVLSGHASQRNYMVIWPPELLAL